MNNIEELVSTLIAKLKSSDQVFLMPHIFADVDTLSSCFAMAFIAKHYNKKTYIILDDDINKLDKSAINIINIIKDYFPLIKKVNYYDLKTNNDLIVVCDVNKTDLIPLKKIQKKDKLIVIDHHEIDKNVIDTNYIYIDNLASSACEIVYSVIKKSDIKLIKDISDCLLAGIYLDTNRLSNINNYKTFDVISNLLRDGADYRRVKKIFINDFLSDRKVHNLINKTYINNNIAICITDNNTIFTIAELAKAADYLIDFNFDAAFAIGYIENNLIAISARSNGDINVQKIMMEFNGGGTISSSAARICNSTIENVYNKLINIIDNKEVKKYEKRC